MSNSFLSLLIDAWRDRARLGDKNRSRDELAFMPAALEIMETPPHPLAHWVGRTLMLLCVVALVWACFGKVNIVATAEGKIIPSARIKQIQPLEKGVVKNILVKEGDHVTKGQPLIELDRTLTASDQQRFMDELKQAQRDLWRLDKFMALLSPQPQAVPTPGRNLNQSQPGKASIPASNDEDSIESQLLEQQWQQYQAQRAAMESALESHKAEKASSLEQIKKLQATLPLVTKRSEGLKSLMEMQMASESEYSQIEEQRINQQQDLAAELAKQKQLEAAISQAEQQLKALEAQTRSDTLSKIDDTEQKIREAQEALNKATEINAKQVLYAPVDGQVQGLAINTIGGVVTDAQQLMTIVPDGENLEVEAYLQNKDIGFVHKNDEAEIKIHTFPFTKYGVINARVSRISNDAFVTHDSDKTTNPSQAKGATPATDQGLVYTLGLVMEKNSLRVNGEDVMLMPGMAVTAEVKTGERRIIEFFLAPLLKAKQESIRER